MNRIHAITISLLSLVAATLPAAEPAPDYNRDVAPIFRKYCQGCHSADEPEKGLVLESYDALLKGGQSGAAIVPSASDKSRLLLMLDGRAKPVMPPKDNEAPSAAEIAIIKRWIDTGAKGPTGQAPDPTQLVTPKIAVAGAARRAIPAVAISPDGKLWAVAGHNEVRILSPESRAVVRRLSDLRGDVAALSFSADGKTLLAAGGEPGLFGEVKLYNVADFKPIKTVTGHKDSLYAAVLSPDGKLLATGSYDQQIKIWDVASGKETKTLTGHNGAVFDLAFHPNGKILASASADRTVKLWDVAKGERLDTLSQSLKDIYTVAFSPDGQHVAGGGVDSRIRIWKLSPTAKENTNPLVVTRFVHEGAVLKLVFARDGKTLASAGEDRTIKVLDTKQFTERRNLEKQSDFVTALAFAADNKSLLVGRLDGTLALYDTATGQAVAPAKPEITAVEPRALQRGVSTKLKISGKNLLGATAVALKSSEMSAKSLAVKLMPQAEDQSGASEVSVEVTPDARLARGNVSLVVTTPGGASNEMSIYVDDLKQFTEREPNNSASQAEVVTMPAAYWGVASARGDLDHFRFDAKAGQTIVMELAAKKLNSTLNAMLILLDPAGEVVATNNDFDGQSDPLVAYTIPADGRYTVRVQDLTLTGSATHFYRLTIGELPYVTGVFPLSVPVNQESTIELAGYNLPADAKLAVKPTKAGDLPIMLDANRFRSGQSFKVSATSDPELVEAEPNDQPAKAMTLPTLSASRVVHVNGRIWPKQPGQTADVDLFRFESRRGETWIIETAAAMRGSPVDTKVEVLDALGKPVERLLLQAVLDSYITFRPITSVAADVRVKNWEEMELNQFLYMQGEVCKIFRMPQGPDSGFAFYANSGKRRDYFDTSSTAHAMDEPCYIVEPHAPGTKLLPNGLPVFPVYYVNDDDAYRELGSDSRLMFTAPADGAYLVRVTDVRGFGGDRFAYLLSIREPKPDFNVRLANTAPTVNLGSGTALNFRADRIDGFDGDIRIEITGLPPGFSVSSPLEIQSGHADAKAVLNVAADAKEPPADSWKNVRIVAQADVNGHSVTKDVNRITSAKLAVKPKVIVHLEPAELTIAPGTTITATLRVDRNGFKGRVQFDVQNLPHGVIVDNIGLNGILIPEDQDQRQLFLQAAGWVPETDRTCFAEAKNLGADPAGGNQSSRPLLLKVRQPSTVAEAKK
jgi:WD40 repeat protein